MPTLSWPSALAQHIALSDGSTMMLSRVILIYNNSFALQHETVAVNCILYKAALFPC